MIWLLPLACATIGLLALVWFAHRTVGEIDPTIHRMRAFGRDLRPLLLKVRDQTERTRRRFDG